MPLKKYNENRIDKTVLPGNGACVAFVSFELTSGTARLFLGCREAGSSYSQRDNQKDYFKHYEDQMHCMFSTVEV